MSILQGVILSTWPRGFLYGGPGPTPSVQGSPPNRHDQTLLNVDLTVSWHSTEMPSCEGWRLGIDVSPPPRNAGSTPKYGVWHATLSRM